MPVIPNKGEAVGPVVAIAGEQAHASGVAARHQPETVIAPPSARPLQFPAACLVLAIGACLYRKLNSAIMMMKSAEDRHSCDAAYVLDGAMDRSLPAKQAQKFLRVRLSEFGACIIAFSARENGSASE